METACNHPRPVLTVLTQFLSQHFDVEPLQEAPGDRARDPHLTTRLGWERATKGTFEFQNGHFVPARGRANSLGPADFRLL